MSNDVNIIEDKQLARLVQFSLAQPLTRFCFLWVITFGIYGFHWYYMNWRSLKEGKISSLGLTILSNFTVYSLAKRVFRLAEWQGIPVYVAPSVIWIVYFIGNLMSVWLPGFWFLVGLIPVLIPIMYVQHILNKFWAKFYPPKEQLEFFSGGLIAWSIAGLVLWVLVILSILDEMAGRVA